MTAAEALSAGISDVSLRVPAETGYASTLRTLAAGLAARLDFTMDDIEDLRMAISEGCAIVLDGADPQTQLTCDFWLTDGRITARLAVVTSSAPLPQQDTFAWQVLSALTSDVTTSSIPGEFSLTLTLESSLAEADS